MYGKQTIESWNFKIDSKDKILELASKVDGSMMRIRLVDTSGVHYGIILETKTRPGLNCLFVKDAPEDVPILYLEDIQGDLCSF